MIQTVLVAGGGSAGLLTALIVKKTVPQVNVTVVRSSEIGVIGVGESTTVAIPGMLHGYLELDPGEFYRRVQPSWKLGLRFLWGSRPYFDYTFDSHLDWKWKELRRPNGFYCDEDFSYVNILSALMSENKAFERRQDGGPVIHRNIGYHLENRRFVAYLEDMATQRGIAILEGLIAGATQNENGITGVQLESGQTLSADLYFDCTGFRSLLLGKTLQEPYIPFKSTLFCDRALVGSWMRTQEVIKPYTTAETMTNGWCWAIEHPDIINRGYVYSSAFISDEEAEQEYRALCPMVEDAKIIPYATGRYIRGWVKNVVGIGNSAGFVEPLESTALAVICDQARIVSGILSECNQSPTPRMIQHYNHFTARLWDEIRDFLGIHYKFNTRLDSTFWRACRNDSMLGPVQELVDYYQDQGPSSFFRNELLHHNNLFTMEGYLTLLVGQKVPYRARYSPTNDELRVWQSLRATNRQRAERAYTVREALDVVMSPQCTWVPGFFKVAVDSQVTNFIGAFA
jgi:tryptophan halogenase